ncbi:MAG: hypothetical protein II669_04430 [Elusimicrobia bacterium]|nr:hypothetical protein [Elusimicrobiota bacterium]
MRAKRKSYKAEMLLNPESLELLTQKIAEGMSVKEFCKLFGISVTWFYIACSRYNEIKEAYYLGLQSSVFEAEKSLYRLCNGFFVEEEKIKEDGTKIIYKKYIPPSVPAIMFFLKNRDPKNWRDRWDVQLEGGVAPVVIKNDLTE